MKISLGPLFFALAATVLLFMLLSPQTGLHIDEGPYIIAGRNAAGWLKELFSAGPGILQAPAIDNWWSYNHEHPPFGKIIFGLADLLLRPWLGPIVAPRAGALLFFLIAQASIYFLLLPFGRWQATLGALLPAAQPHLFFHALTVTVDLPAVSMSLLCLLFFIRGLEKHCYAPLCGIAWGLAMASKINGVFLALPLFVWGYSFKRKQVVDNIFWMIILGPLTVFAVWPWLWHDTLVRVLDYLRFHAAHVHEPVYLWGRVFQQPPWYYPLLILAVVTPAFILLGALLSLRLPDQSEARRLSWLLWGMAAVSVLVVMPPSVPVYNAVRLFLLAPAMLAPLAALGVGQTLRLTIFKRREPWGKWFAVMLLLMPGMLGVITSHPYLLSYYNELVGFRAGAVRLGFDPLPWAQIEPALVRWLQEKYPQGATIVTNSGPATILKSYQALQLLPKNFKFAEDGDLWVIEEILAYSGFERWWRLRRNEDQAYEFLHSFEHGGQRFISVYRRRTEGTGL